jgi:hypothetical protein
MPCASPDPPGTPKEPRGPTRRPPERLLAWLVTGPLGHLYGGLADIVAGLARYGLLRARRARRGG